MKTRTLLLLALGCAVAIMVAGAVMLFQLTRDQDAGEPTPIGRAVEVGDMGVTVQGAEEVGGVLSVHVRIGGVDDPDGTADFRLIASGRPIRQEPGTCGPTAVAAQECELRFDVSTADGTSRVLFYDRGDDQARWVLS